MQKTNLILVFILLIFITQNSCKQKYNNKSYDILIYGATSAGIIAAVQAKKKGKSVIVINPDNHIGGLTTGGLGQTDIGNKMVIGGLSREFYQRIKSYYSKEINWKWEQRFDYNGVGQSRTEDGEDAMWTFEPGAAMKVFMEIIDEYNLTIVNDERLDLKGGVNLHKGKIVSIKAESGKSYQAKIYIDATYEGDLMAVSGVSYTYGREGISEYGESLNGVQTSMATHHQLPDGIDPYVVKGNPDSGLLPGIHNSSGTEGSSDKNIQAYCFRMCLTDVDENRIPFEKPDNYNELEYELLFRSLEINKHNYFFIMSMMPNRKTDANNLGGFSSDFIGRNYNYPEGDYSQRTSIINEHENYQLGLLWTLANHPRIPEDIRSEWQRWGLPKDEYVDNGHWTPQLYIREARRMISSYIMTEHHCTQDSISAEQSVGMGAYTMDSHHTQRYVTSDGFVKNEGDIQVGGFSPYPIDYRSIVPKKEECSNLLVPVCLSSSHIAFGSIRMEPVFMVLGQSASIAACIAIDKGVAIQNVPYTVLKEELIKNEQRLEYSP